MFSERLFNTSNVTRFPVFRFLSPSLEPLVDWVKLFFKTCGPLLSFTVVSSFGVEGFSGCYFSIYRTSSASSFLSVCFVFFLGVHVHLFMNHYVTGCLGLVPRLVQFARVTKTYRNKYWVFNYFSPSSALTLWLISEISLTGVV